MVSIITENFFKPALNQHFPLEDYCSTLLVSENIALGSVNTIILQPNFTNKLSPTIHNDQANLVRLGAAIKDIQGSTLANMFLTILHNTSEEVTTMLQALLEYTIPLDGENPNDKDAINTFTDIITEIQQSHTRNQEYSSRTIESLKDNLGIFKDTLDDITTHATNIKATLDNLADDLKTFTEKAEALHGQLDDLNAEIAKGATTKIKDCVMLGISTGACFAGEEAVEPNMVIAAAVGVIGEGGNFSDFDDELQEQYDQQNELIDKIRGAVIEAETKNTEYGMLAITYASSQRLYKNLQTQLQTAENIINILSAWNGQLTSLCNKLGTKTAAGFYISEVDNGISYWQSVKQVCKNNLGILASSQYSENEKNE